MARTVRAGLVAALVLGGGCISSAERRFIAETKGQPAKDFTLVDLSGERVSLHALRGRPVVLTFFGTT